MGLSSKSKDTKHNIMVLEKCPECGGTSFFRDYSRGEIVCSNCGLIISEYIIDSGPEWRAFTSDEQLKKSRIGSPMTLTIHDKGLSTVIDWRGFDAYGRKLKPKRRIEVMRWRKWQLRSSVYSSIARNLVQAMSILDRICSQLGLPKSLREEAALIYRKAVEKGLVRGRSIESMMAASIYGACRIKKIPRTLDEIAVFTKYARKDVARCYRLLLKEVDLNVSLVDSNAFIPRIASELKLSGSVQHKAFEIIQEAKSKFITAGKDPKGLAAASLYIASILEGEKITQKEIAKVAMVTEVTVRNRYKGLVRKLNIVLPDR